MGNNSEKDKTKIPVHIIASNPTPKTDVQKKPTYYPLEETSVPIPIPIIPEKKQIDVPQIDVPENPLRKPRRGSPPLKSNLSDQKVKETYGQNNGNENRTYENASEFSNQSLLQTQQLKMQHENLKLLLSIYTNAEKILAGERGIAMEPLWHHYKKSVYNPTNDAGTLASKSTDIFKSCIKSTSDLAKRYSEFHGTLTEPSRNTLLPDAYNTFIQNNLSENYFAIRVLCELFLETVGKCRHMATNQEICDIISTFVVALQKALEAAIYLGADKSWKYDDDSSTECKDDDDSSTECKDDDNASVECKDDDATMKWNIDSFFTMANFINNGCHSIYYSKL
jgi:hypothetical protein